MNKTEIKYISLLTPLFYLYGTIFLWSKNAHMFSLIQFTYSFVVILSVAIILYSLVYFLLYHIQKIIPYSKKLQIGISLFIAALVGLVGNFCFLKVIFFPYHHAVMWGIIISIFVIIYLKQIKKLISFMIILFVLSFGINVFPTLHHLYIIANNFYSYLKESDSDNNFLVKFDDTPNIYLFWLESFQGTRTLKNTFDADITPLITYLNEKNFSVCENMYSSSGATLISMLSLYSFGKFTSTNFHFGEIGFADAIQPARTLVGGGAGNTLLKVLKFNNYTTNILTNDLGYFNYKGKYLDYNELLDTINPLQIKLLPSYYFTKLYEKMDTMNQIGNISHNINKLPLKEQIKNQIDKMQKKGLPYFFAWKEDTTFHSPIRGQYTYLQRDSWIKTGGYKEAIEKTSTEVIPEIINMILEVDKNAIIVLLGDHGAHTYRGIYDDLTMLTKNNISLSDYVDDRFNVFCAVRLPEKYAKFSFDGGDTYINHMNIFVHIFSLLAQNPEYIKLQEIPISILGNHTFVKNGKINDELQ